MHVIRRPLYSTLGLSSACQEGRHNYIPVGLTAAYKPPTPLASTSQAKNKRSTSYTLWLYPRATYLLREVLN